MSSRSGRWELAWQGQRRESTPPEGPGTTTPTRYARVGLYTSAAALTELAARQLLAAAVERDQVQRSPLARRGVAVRAADLLAQADSLSAVTHHARAARRHAAHTRLYRRPLDPGWAVRTGETEQATASLRRRWRARALVYLTGRGRQRLCRRVEHDTRRVPSGWIRAERGVAQDVHARDATRRPPASSGKRIAGVRRPLQAKK